MAIKDLIIMLSETGKKFLSKMNQKITEKISLH
jgi:hypothetical protein